jgi:hypothetical protein
MHRVEPQAARFGTGLVGDDGGGPDGDLRIGCDEFCGDREVVGSFGKRIIVKMSNPRVLSFACQSITPPAGPDEMIGTDESRRRKLFSEPVENFRGIAIEVNQNFSGRRFA